jgi:hypothetical protein
MGMMDSFRYILYVYKRTILRASGREKDKKTRCGSARRSNGTTGGSKTHEVRVRLGNIYGLACVLSNNDLSGISVDGGKTYSGFKNFNGRQTVESARGMDGSFASMQVEFYAAIGKLPTLDPYVSVYIWRRTA